MPLPQKSEFFIETAHLFEYEGNDKMYFMLYNGLQNNLNTTIDPEELLLPNVFEQYHKKWFDFRLQAIKYNWVFKMFAEQLSEINKKIFAYGRYHILRRLEKTQISEDLFEVEIETETLP